MKLHTDNCTGTARNVSTRKRTPAILSLFAVVYNSCSACVAARFRLDTPSGIRQLFGTELVSRGQPPRRTRPTKRVKFTGTLSRVISSVWVELSTGFHMAMTLSVTRDQYLPATLFTFFSFFFFLLRLKATASKSMKRQDFFLSFFSVLFLLQSVFICTGKKKKKKKKKTKRHGRCSKD